MVIPVSNPVVTGCGEVDLRAAIGEATAGSTVTFSCSGTITLTSAGGGAMTLNKDLTIDGSGQQVTISGGGTVRVFLVNSGVSATLNDLTIADGHAAFPSLDAGGIDNAGNLSVTNSTFSGNRGDIGGGAIENTGTLRVSNSTFSGNSGGLAGAIANDGTGAGTSVSVSNSTFSGNSAAVNVGAGGTNGVLSNNSGTLSVTNSTFSGNSADAIRTNAGTVTLANTILARSSGGQNCYGSVTDKGGNLSDDSSCAFTQGSSTNSASGLNLGSLANNGGPNQTIALGAGSAAINIASANCPSTDQRGQARPDVGESTCDSGAYEFNDDGDLGLANVPADISVNATSPRGAAVTYTPPIAVDEAGDSPAATVRCDHASGATFPLGVTTITCTATDSDDTNSPVSAQFAVTVNKPLPTTSGSSPATAAAGSAGFSLTVSGTGFNAGSIVQLDGAALPTHVGSSTQLTADVPANLTAHTALVTVVNPTPGGGTSNPQPLFVTSSGASLVGAPSVATGANASATTGGSGPSTAGSVTVMGSGGSGTVAVAQYAANPGGTPSFASSGAYLDAYVAPGSTYSSVRIVDCALQGGSQALWYNAATGAWVAASNQSYNATTQCTTITVNASSTPTLAQLGGTPFGIAHVPPVVAVPGAQSVPYGSPLSVTVTASEVEPSDVVTLTASGLPAGLRLGPTSFDQASGQWTATVLGTVTGSAGPYTATLAATNGYTTSTGQSVSIAVTPAPLNITADNQTTPYGHIPAYTWTGTGWVNGESTSTLATAPNSAPTCSASVNGAAASATTPPGVYAGALTCAGAVDPNYAISYARWEDGQPARRGRRGGLR